MCTYIPPESWGKKGNRYMSGTIRKINWMPVSCKLKNAEQNIPPIVFAILIRHLPQHNQPAK